MHSHVIKVDHRTVRLLIAITACTDVIQIRVLTKLPVQLVLKLVLTYEKSK